MQDLVKDKLLVVIDGLFMVTKEIEKNLHDLPALIPVLQECQETAIQVGTAIERSCDEFGDAIQQLERYCEELYQISMGNSTHTALLERCLKNTRTFIEKQPKTYVIVFLPYKASMWDCMESIWRAAAARADCECIVCPIPYFDKDQQFNLKEVHYEGLEYPKEVPIVSWKTINLKAMQPDAIFIHNPYDGSNRVTSVHPDFYSEKLCNYTKQLVYVPYAISSKDAVAETFAVLPGTVYADTVVVQSETMKRQYLEYFDKFRTNAQMKPYDKKFVALGSAKFDKAIQEKREAYQYPEDWLKKRSTESGLEKKVVLLNISMNQMLKWNERYLDSLQDILQLFASREDVLLLWRPHPLMKQTYRLMRPQFYDRYIAIVEAYKKADWGIYDDSTDLYRAFSFSDAYYGDWSSIATLYQIAKKPVMLIDQNYRKKELEQESTKNLQINIVGLCIWKNYGYLYNRDNDGVYKVDLTTGDAQLEVVLPHGNCWGDAYLHMELVGNQLYFASNNVPDIVIYNLDTKELICHSGITDEKKMANRFCCEIGGKIYYTPMLGTQISELNGDSICDYSMLGKLPIDDAVISKAAGLPMKKGEHLFIPFHNPNGVIEFDCKEKQMHALHAWKRCITMTTDGETVWWMNADGELYQWKTGTGDSKCIYDFKTDIHGKPGENYIFFLQYAEGKIYIVPHLYYDCIINRSFVYDVESQTVEELKQLQIDPALIDIKNKGRRCFCGLYVDDQENVWTYSNIKESFFVFQTGTGIVKEIPVHYEPGFEVLSDMMDYTYESQWVTLADYLDVITQKGDIHLLTNQLMKLIATRHTKEGYQDWGTEHMDGHCGERIMDYVLNVIKEK